MEDDKIKITREEFKAFVECQIKLNALAGMFSRRSSVFREEFENITGFDVSSKEEADPGICTTKE